MLYDFYSGSVFEALSSENTPLVANGFPILVAVQGNPEENTVIGPGFSLGDEATEISKVVLEADHNCTKTTCKENVARFRSTVDSMKERGPSATSFFRSRVDGGSEEIFIASSKVVARSIRPVDGSNFARGIETNEYLVYTMGLCEAKQDILRPFETIEKDSSKAIRLAVLVIAISICCAAFLLIAISYMVTMSISESMLYLLDLIRCINQ